MTESYLNIAGIRLCTESEGPGKRFALWCQGCEKRCAGCCNPEMQPFEERHIVDVNDLMQLILFARNQHGIEGISVIGGEPILQAAGVSELARLCKKENLSVLVFTGYLLEELRSMENPYINTLLANSDIVIDGPFEQDKEDVERGWVGSTNQAVHFLSDTYHPGIEYVSERSMEILVGSESLFVNGWPFAEDS